MVKIITTGFDYGASNKYSVLMDVFLYSLDKNCPKSTWIQNWLEEPGQDAKARGIISNTVKLQNWIDEFSKAKEGEQIIFMDCDMLVLGDLNPAFDEDFDIAYTVRPSTYPINGGVIFTRNNERTRKFFNKFLEVNIEMYGNTTFHQVWRNKYAGINQAAFGYMVEMEKDIAKLKEVPCAIWNVCQDYEKNIRDGAKVLHIKGGLRRNVFFEKSVETDYKTAVELWRQHYNEFKQNGNK